MKKEDLINTKWDARDWTEDMKEKWFHLMFSHGFLFAGKTHFSPSSFHAGFYFICHEGLIRVGGRGDRVPFEESKNKNTFFHQVFDEEGKQLAFPETEQGQNKTAAPTASDLLSQGAEILNQRGAEYEKDGNQERSFDSVATAFNAITGKDLTVAEVALMLQCVKDVRQWSQDRLHEDSVIDGINYAALKGELLHKQYKG